MERPTLIIEPVITKNKTWFQIVASLTCLTIVICAGMCSMLPVLIGHSGKVGLNDFGSLYLIFYVGRLIGNIIFSTLMDFYGRKTALLIVASVFALSSILLSIFPYSLFAVFCSQFLGGVGEGGVIILIPVYICEISEPRIRGAVASLYQTFYSIGVLLGIFVITNPAPIPSLVILLFSIISFMVFISMPESPYYLIMKGKTERASFSLRKLRRNYNVDEEMSTLHTHLRHEGGFRDLFISSNLRSIMVMSVILFLEVFTGLELIPYITIQDNTIQDITKILALFFMWWLTIVVYAILIASTLIATAVMDLIGRRILLLFSISGCCFSNLFFAVFFFVKLDTQKFKWLLILVLFYLVFSFTVGLKSAAHCLVGELFNVRIKAKAICLVNIFTSLCFLVNGLLQHRLHLYLGTANGLILQFALCGILHFFGFWFCWKLLPETKRKSLEEIQQELKRN